MTKHLCRLLITVNFLILLILPCGVSQAFDTSALIAPKEAEWAAQEGLQRFLDVISDQKPEEFNFRSPGELKRAKVGAPFRVFVASPDGILRGDPKKSLIDCIYPMPEWFFPVISDGETRTFLGVYFIENKWKAGGLGDTHLVRPYASVLKKWPSSQGYKHVFVRNNETLSEFVILMHGGEAKVVPLPSAMMSWGLKEQKVMEQSEAIALLRDRLKQIYRQPKGILH